MCGIPPNLIWKGKLIRASQYEEAKSDHVCCSQFDETFIEMGTNPHGSKVEITRVTMPLSHTHTLHFLLCLALLLSLVWLTHLNTLSSKVEEQNNFHA